MEDSIGFQCARYVGSLLAAVLGLVAFVSPIVMVGLPKLGIKVSPKVNLGIQGQRQGRLDAKVSAKVRLGAKVNLCAKVNLRSNSVS